MLLLKESVNYLSVFLLVLVFDCIQVSDQFPDSSLDKVSGFKAASDSKVSGYDKSSKTRKEADSDGWKNLKSSSKGKLDKSKQDEEMFHGEGVKKMKKVKGFHSESDKHKSQDKGLNKKWNRGDGLMKTWNWNKGGHSEEEEGGKWETTLHHNDKKGKKMGHSKEKASDSGGSHVESSNKKFGSKEKSKKKMEKHQKKEKQSKKWKEDSDRTSESMMDKKMEKIEAKKDKMKFDKYEKPMKHDDGWSDEHDDTFKGKSHPFGYKGVDHSSIHGGRLSKHAHNKDNFMSKKGKKDKFDSLDEKIDDTIDKNLPDELKSLKDMEEDIVE